jgi:hypothetical protein
MYFHSHEVDGHRFTSTTCTQGDIKYKDGMDEKDIIKNEIQVDNNDECISFYRHHYDY